jgi:hypothetical protein
MESTELVSDDEEHPEWLSGVFHFGQEIWRQTERQSHFGGLVKVCFEDMPG